LLEQDFSSVPSFGIHSSVNPEMPQNEHFLPWNNGSHSKSIRGIFPEPNSVANPSCYSQLPPLKWFETGL
jgi:hypothetical protein